MNITSTTDSAEAVTAALGDLVEPPVPAAEKTAPADKAGETAAASGAEVAKDGDGNPIPPKKKTGGFKKKVGRLTAQISAMGAELEQLRAQSLKGQSAVEKQPTPDKAAVDPTKPVKEKFESHDDYIEALTDWKFEKRMVKEKAEAQQAAQRAEAGKQVDTYVSRLKAFKETAKDFDEVMDEISDVKAQISIQQHLLEHENGPELVYALGKDRKEFERINSLPAVKALVELGKFEAKQEIGKKPAASAETKTTTKAPKPITPLGGGASGETGTDGYREDFTQAQYEKWREKQERKSA